MANPSHLRPSWRQINQALSSPHPAYIARANPSTSYHRGASLRPFHTTPTQSARPRQSPSVRRANASSTPAHLSLPHTTKGGQRLDRDGFWWARIGRDPNPMLEDFAAIAPILYQASSNHGLIPPSVTFNTYKNVSEQLITLAYTEYAGAFNIKTVSTDVDAIFRIATSLVPLPSGPALREWAKSACARGKSRRALVELVNKYIEIDSVDIHRNTEWIALVKDFALKDEYPQAIMLYAKILTWRGEGAQAAELLEEKILPYIRASPRQPQNPFCDITLGGGIDSPLRLYGLAISATKGIDEVSKVMERAALEFSEPIALTELAISHLEGKDWDRYEELMSMAATSGYKPACFYLANYYLRMSKGEYLTRQERAEVIRGEPTGWMKTLEPLRLWIDSIVYNPLDRTAYRNLAKEWYMIAQIEKPTAALILAMMEREEGHITESRSMFERVSRDDYLTELPEKAIRQLDQNWDDPDYEPEYPLKFMPVG
ncbi:hypothetical protein N7541_006400 [Penicillium brevicompactum]|uniref:Uncharacterized protein n=1 Tax=Penicillium brevicompactum TaxID=5074 RepID=A0A9W9R525_PENBR|nr:hypothetical protein N7541_006400 [Penicillium brevicompactum]